LRQKLQEPILVSLDDSTERLLLLLLLLMASSKLAIIIVIIMPFSIMMTVTCGWYSPLLFPPAVKKRNKNIYQSLFSYGF